MAAALDRSGDLLQVAILRVRCYEKKTIEHKAARLFVFTAMPFFSYACGLSFRILVHGGKLQKYETVFIFTAAYQENCKRDQHVRSQKSANWSLNSWPFSGSRHAFLGITTRNTYVRLHISYSFFIFRFSVFRMPTSDRFGRNLNAILNLLRYFSF